MDDYELYERLLQRFGSPVYVYCLDTIGKQVRSLQAALPLGHELLYSVKANPHPDIIQAAVDAGCGVEVSSLGELRTSLPIAKRAGASVLLTGPAKSLQFLEHAFSEGCTFVSAESAADMDRISQAASSTGVVASCIVRLNVDEPVRGAPLIMAGKPTAFGTDLKMVDRASLLRQRQATEIVGAHFYLASNIADVDQLMRSFEVAIGAADEIVARSGLNLAVLDLGGGFGAPFARSGDPCDLSIVRKEMEPLLARSFGDSRPRLIFESGRFIAGPSGTLIARVVDAKKSKGRAFLVTDSGIHHLAGLNGLGRVPPIEVEIGSADGSRFPDAAELDSTIAGVLCTPLDVWSRRGPREVLEPGTMLMTPNVGAYGLTASLIGFLSHPAPVEVSIVDGQIVSASQLSLERRQLP